MNYIKNLSCFLEKVQYETRIAPSQISLYLALFYHWNKQRFTNPIIITRDEMMRMSKINSKSTYHRSLKVLHELGYLIYKPSHSPFFGSKVIMIDLTASGKNTMSVNNLISALSVEHSVDEEATLSQEHVVPLAPGLHKLTVGKKNKAIPTLEEVKAYFASKQQPESEAEKFFYYFESVGWLVGGKSKMKNWKAACNNWVLNVDKFTSTKAGGVQKTLDTSVNKRYDEPL